MTQDKTKEKRCKFCRKLLVSEKELICRRCELKGERIVAETLGVAVTAAGVAATAAAFKALSSEADKND